MFSRGDGCSKMCEEECLARGVLEVVWERFVESWVCVGKEENGKERRLLGRGPLFMARNPSWVVGAFSGYSEGEFSFRDRKSGGR